jgi:hypothetical protein
MKGFSIGIWRWESELTARIMTRFPSSVNRYIDKNSPNTAGCCSALSKSPMRWNSEVLVIFSSSKLIGHL